MISQISLCTFVRYLSGPSLTPTVPSYPLSPQATTDLLPVTISACIFIVFNFFLLKIKFIGIALVNNII